MASKHVRCSTSLDIRKMQVKSTMSYHYFPIRIAILKNSDSNKCWHGWGETCITHIVGRTMK